MPRRFDIRRKCTFFGLMLALLVSLDEARAETVLYSFQGGTDGYWPTAGVIMDNTGNLYGTTQMGGGTGCGGSGCGTVYKLTPDGAETVLYSFAGGNDGANPDGGLLRDTSGNLYGTTVNGGPSNEGVVFKISPKGKETLLHAFSGGSDGAGPHGGLIADSAGNLYGTTAKGGGGPCNTSGCGTIYKLKPDGAETVLYAFQISDGAFPQAGLLADSDGNLYGTTASGGGNNDDGTVFKFATDGTLTVLHSFEGGGDGANPEGGVIMDATTGNLYGTTIYGGHRGYECGDDPCGTLFEVAPSDSETVLHGFKDWGGGAFPVANVVMDEKGNFYGTTWEGGSGLNASGLVFKIGPGGKETVLHSFQAGSDGAFPQAGLIPGNGGKLYGTTIIGGGTGCGGDGCGTVFAIKK